MNAHIFQHVLNEVVKAGVKEFCLCPGSRNSPFISCLMQSTSLTYFNWYEERSAAFFALGRARNTGRPVAVITTSGTAAGELLPATMEAYYTGAPLLLITADRPRRFRGTGAPQSAEQVGLFSVYAGFSQDIEGDEFCHIGQWDWTSPAHLNICIEEPKSYNANYYDLSSLIPQKLDKKPLKSTDSILLDRFFERSNKPLVIVGELPKEEREAVKQFLLRLNAPIYTEAASGLREDPSLSKLQIRMETGIWHLSQAQGYDIDGVLRLGGVPVTRLWRDLEEAPNRWIECSISNVPFSGLSWGSHIHCDLNDFLASYKIPENWTCTDFTKWFQSDCSHLKKLQELFDQFPASEPALFQQLSEKIPDNALVYLGNSLPIREWDLAATFKNRNIEIKCSRGVNGIDGQISTFLGMCEPDRENWAIIGDLTALYDFAALWILKSLPSKSIKIVVVNNGGGKIFARIYKDPIFQHLHHFDFEPFAKSWDIPYFCMEGQLDPVQLPEQAFIELCPNPITTDCFWKAYDELMQKKPV